MRAQTTVGAHRHNIDRSYSAWQQDRSCLVVNSSECKPPLRCTHATIVMRGAGGSERRSWNVARMPAVLRVNNTTPCVFMSTLRVDSWKSATLYNSKCCNCSAALFRVALLLQYCYELLCEWTRCALSNDHSGSNMRSQFGNQTLRKNEICSEPRKPFVLSKWVSGICILKSPITETSVKPTHFTMFSKLILLPKCDADYPRRCASQN